MSGSIYIYVCVCVERNKSFNITLFLDYKAINFEKQFYYCSKHSPSIASYYSQKIFYLLLNFLGKESTIESLYPMSSIGLQR